MQFIALDLSAAVYEFGSHIVVLKLYDRLQYGILNAVYKRHRESVRMLFGQQHKVGISLTHGICGRTREPFDIIAQLHSALIAVKSVIVAAVAREGIDRKFLTICILIAIGCGGAYRVEDTVADREARGHDRPIGNLDLVFGVGRFIADACDMIRLAEVFQSRPSAFLVSNKSDINTSFGKLKSRRHIKYQSR